MATQATERTRNTSPNTGATLVALAGAGLVGYGLIILIRNVSGFTEPGLEIEHMGVPLEQVRSFSQDLYNYILHV